MVAQIGQFARNIALLIVLVTVAACGRPEPSGAAPFAAYVMDARTGETLHARNAETRLHPASLTKMMTLYIAFQEIEAGRISPDTMVTISAHAAGQPPSRLGLRAGQTIALRYLIRAAAVKSANDAATAIGEAISGSEPAFARRMTETARALGMPDTTFRNANGLTADGHLSTAKDMSVLGRHLFYDFPQYYNIFSRRSTDAGLAEVNNTNRRFLDAYEGADGIKTGFTNAAGFNLTASAERGGVRIIATVFGGTSTANRNAKMAELLDLGFSRAPRNAPVTITAGPALVAANDAAPATDDAAIAAAVADAAAATQSGQTVRLVTTLSASPVPRRRPGAAPAEVAVADAGTAATEQAVLAMQDDIAGALAEALGEEVAPANTDAAPVAVAEDTTGTDTLLAAVEPLAPDVPFEVVANAAADAAAAAEVPAESLEGQAIALADDAADPLQPAAFAAVAPPARPVRSAPIYDTPGEEAAAPVLLAAAEQEGAAAPEEVVLVMSTSGGRHWGVNVGRFPSRAEAERALLRTQLAESATLNESLRKVSERGGGYDANFMGLTQDQADLACRRLQARAIQCFTIGE
ncbi:MAG: D-alanyl-D-alanine carboxypeptidase [Rhodobacteraceae bacterium]|nr:D-alanyl-D-alanine carboxypeptidase [Paracoccaceae bacterium]